MSMSKITVEATIESFSERFPLAEVGFANVTLQPWLFGCHLKIGNKNLLVSPALEGGAFILEFDNDGGISRYNNASPYDPSTMMVTVSSWYTSNAPIVTVKDMVLRHSTSSMLIMEGLDQSVMMMIMENSGYNIYSESLGEYPISINIGPNLPNKGSFMYIISYDNVTKTYTDIDKSLDYLHGLINKYSIKG